MTRASARSASLLVVLGFGVLLFLVRLAGPPDLTDNDQEGPSAYVLDIVQNGHWLVQRDANGEIASKPPLFSWLAALATMGAGRISRLTLYLPCALAMVGTAVMLVRAGRSHFGETAGLLAALALYFSQFGLKHVALARTDALFMATVTLAALAAFRAWNTGRGWPAFWLAAAAASLTKGPLGLGLAAAGLLAALWERRDGQPHPVRFRWWPGAGLYLALTGGWFALAYAEVGAALTDKQLGRELMGHLSGSSAGGHWPGSNPLHPLAYFLSRFAPWSLLACLGFWRAWRRPSDDPGTRRFERFLLCWFLAGLAIFTIAPHKRADLLLPIIPAAALVAGRELAHWLSGMAPSRVRAGAVVMGLAGLLAVPVLARLKVEAPEATSRTLAMKRMADWLRTNAPADLPLTFVGNTMTLQFYFNRHQFQTSPEAAAALLRGEAACVVAASDPRQLRELAGTNGASRELTPPDIGGPWVGLLGNRSALTNEPVSAIVVGPVNLRLTGATLVRSSWLDFEIRPQHALAGVAITHNSPRPLTVGIRWSDGSGGPIERRAVDPGQSWAATYSASNGASPPPTLPP